MLWALVWASCGLATAGAHKLTLLGFWGNHSTATDYQWNCYEVENADLLPGGVVPFGNFHRLPEIALCDSQSGAWQCDTHPKNVPAGRSAAVFRRWDGECTCGTENSTDTQCRPGLAACGNGAGNCDEKLVCQVCCQNTYEATKTCYRIEVWISGCDVCEHNLEVDESDPSKADAEALSRSLMGQYVYFFIMAFFLTLHLAFIFYKLDLIFGLLSQGF